MHILLVAVGLAVVVVGAFFEVVAALGMIRLRSFFLRLHAATMGCVGGSILPLLGLALIALGLESVGVERLYVAGTCTAGAIILLVLAPSGAHSLARAAYMTRAAPRHPLEFDALEERLKGGGR
uniref:Cation:proton antiporter n=1 Tax=Ignisphaera aggregans TaxID=334771 RepID=A0A7C4BCL9_9CREN